MKSIPGGVIIVGGRSYDNDFLDTLYRLPHSKSKWQRMEARLNVGRSSHVAIRISSDFSKFLLVTGNSYGKSQ